MNIHKSTRLTLLDRREIWRLYQTRLWNTACKQCGIDQKFTRVDRPQTNAKAERVIRTLGHVAQSDFL